MSILGKQKCFRQISPAVSNSFLWDEPTGHPHLCVASSFGIQRPKPKTGPAKRLQLASVGLSSLRQGAQVALDTESMKERKDRKEEMSGLQPFVSVSPQRKLGILAWLKSMWSGPDLTIAGSAHALLRAEMSSVEFAWETGSQIEVILIMRHEWWNLHRIL